MASHISPLLDSPPPDIDEILSRLSVIPRWCGATIRPYSVLDHIVDGCAVLNPTTSLDDELLSWLFHDLHEAMISDIPSIVGVPHGTLSMELNLLKKLLDKHIAQRLQQQGFLFRPTIPRYRSTVITDKLMVFLELATICNDSVNIKPDPLFDPTDYYVKEQLAVFLDIRTPEQTIAAWKQTWNRHRQAKTIPIPTQP